MSQMRFFQSPEWLWFLTDKTILLLKYILRIPPGYSQHIWNFKQIPLRRYWNMFILIVWSHWIGWKYYNISISTRRTTNDGVNSRFYGKLFRGSWLRYFSILLESSFRVIVGHINILQCPTFFRLFEYVRSLLSDRYFYDASRRGSKITLEITGREYDICVQIYGESFQLWYIYRRFRM